MAAPNFPDLGPIGDSSGEAAAKPRVDEPTDLEKANARVEAAEARERDANAALRTSVAQRTPPAAPALGEIAPPEPGEMPDPATDPEGFKSWDAQKRAYDNHQNRQHTNSVRDAAVANNRSDRIVDEYMGLHPKYANLRNHVWQCFKDAAAELHLSELPDETTALDALVDKKMKHLVAEAVKATDLPTGDPSIDEDPAQRTGGLSAGSEGGPAGGSPPAKDGEIVPVSLYDTMRNRQAKSGLF